MIRKISLKMIQDVDVLKCSLQKCFNNYSFEELRFASPALQRQSENMLVRANNDGTFSANWTPGNIGGYKIHVTIDGCEMAETFKVSK